MIIIGITFKLKNVLYLFYKLGETIIFFVIISVVRTEDWKVKPFLDLNYKSSPCRWWDLEPGGWRKVGQTRSLIFLSLSYIWCNKEEQQ